MASESPTLTILFENKHWLAVNKIPKLSVERSPFQEDTIESLVYDYLSKSYKNPYVGIVHRLDRVTTGVLLFAKRKSTLRKINEQFRNKLIKKTYLAIVEEAPPSPKDTLTNYLWKDRKNKKGMVHAAKTETAVESILHYQEIGQSNNGHLLQVNPITGKFHQIRVQLSHIGCPILGDIKYGATKHISPNSIALHAWKLSFINPTTNQTIYLQAPIPQKDWWYDFAEVLNTL